MRPTGTNKTKTDRGQTNPVEQKRINTPVSLRTVAGYFIFGVLWILLSDTLLLLFVPHSSPTYVTIQSIKGWLFVSLSALVIYFILKTDIRALETSEGHLRGILNAAPDAMVVLQRGGQIVLANAQVRQVFGYEPEELIGQGVDFLMPERFRAEHRHHQTQYFHAPRHRADSSMTLYGLRKDGREFPVNINLSHQTIDGELFVIAAIRDITEWKAAEGILRESRELYQELFESNPQPMWVYDLETLAFKMVNDAAVAHYGYTREEFLGMTLQDIRPAEDVPALLENIAQKTQPLEKSSGWRHLKKDGAVIDVEISSHATEFNGRPARLVLAKDVTERKQAEDALKQSEEHFRLTFENANIGVCLVGLDGRLLRVNQRLCDMLGYSRALLEAMTVNSIAYPDDTDLSPRFMQQAVTGQEEHGTFEKRYLHKQGHIVWGQVSSTLIKDKEGRPLYFISHVLDITDQKRAETALKVSEENYRSLAETSEGAIAVLNRDGAILYVNPAAIRIWGNPELIGKNVRDIFPAETARRYLAVVQRVIDDRAVMTDELESLINDQQKWFRISMSPLKNPDGSVNAMLLNAWDVTEEKQAEAQIQQMKRLYAMLSQVNQTIVRVTRQDELFQSICDMVVKFGEFSLAWVGLLDQESGEIKPVAANGLDINHWTLPIINIYKEEFKHTMAAEAIRTGKVLTNEDAQTDPRLSGFKKSIQDKPYHASAVVPFKRGGKVIGALGIVSTQAGHFKAEEELALLSEMGMDISFALDMMETERIKQQWADAFEHSAHGMVIGDVHTNRILACNPAFANDQGATIQELIDLPLKDMYRPEDQERIKQLIAQSDREGKVQFEGVKLRKDGRAYPFQLDMVSVRDENGNLLYRVASQQDITERQQKDEALKRNERVLRLFVEHSPASIAMFDRDMRYIVHSRRYLTDYQLPQQDLTGLSHYDVFPEIPERWKEIHRRCLAGNIEQADEDPFPRLDGRLDYVQWEIHPWYDDDGSIGGIILFSEVVTERIRARNAIRESERQMYALVNSLDDIVFEFDAQGTYLNVWGNDESLLAQPKEQVLGRRMADVLGAETARPFEEAVRRVLAGGDPEMIEYPLEVLGGMRWFVAEISPIQVPGEATKTASMLIRDITERKQAEEDLQASEAKYRSLVTSWDNSIGLMDADGRYVYINETGAEWYGKTPQEMIGKSLQDLFPDQYKEAVPQPAREVFEQNQGTVYETESRFGNGRWFRVSIQPVSDPDGRVTHVTINSMDITERKQAEIEIRQRNEDLLLINALNDAANRGEGIEAITEVFAREARKVFNCQDAAIYLLSPDGEYLEMQNTTISPQVTERIENMLGVSIPRIRLPVHDHGHIQAFLTSQNGTIIDDPVQIKAWIMEFTETTFLPKALRPVVRKLVPQVAKLLDIRSLITMPLVSAGRVVGLMELSSRNHFADDDLQRVRSISHQVTAAIFRKQAEANVQRQFKRLTALNRIDLAINSGLDLRLSLDIVLNETLLQLGVDAACILLLNKAGYQLEYMAGKGFRTSAITQTQLRLGEGYPGRVGLGRKTLHVPDLNAEAGAFIRKQLLQKEDFVEYFGVPLVAKGELKGVLEIFNRSNLNTDPEWLNYLETLGGQAAIAIDNLQLFEGLQQSNQELIAAYDATIAGWSHAMDLRDKETEGHTLRVTDLTVRLAKRMNVSQQEMIHIRRGALLHDIGKLGVPDQILLKPGKLTDEEWVVMRRHPTYAYEMLLPIYYLKPALDIPYCHHEKWDGTGYPRGLKGEQIPLSARIFAIVDVWDALRSDRPYRPGWELERIREYILEQSGKHFDPQVVEAFLQMINEGE